MIRKTEVQLGEIASVVEKMTDEGRLTKSMGAALKSVVSSVFRTVYGEKWYEMTVARLDAEKIFEDFINKKAEEGVTLNASEIYHRRFRRAVSLYGRLPENKNDNEDGEVVKMGETNKTLKKLVENISATQEVLSLGLFKKVFREECKKDYDVYAIPVGADETVAVALPKKMTAEELDKVGNLIEGILVHNKVKKGGGM